VRLTRGKNPEQHDIFPHSPGHPVPMLRYGISREEWIANPPALRHNLLQRFLHGDQLALRIRPRLTRIDCDQLLAEVTRSNRFIYVFRLRRIREESVMRQERVNAHIGVGDLRHVEIDHSGGKRKRPLTI
jgi:hypothetical protein